jgi:hypothetical protein
MRYSPSTLLSTFRRCQDSRERGKGDWHWLFTKKNILIYNACILPVSPPRKRAKTYSALKILLKCHFHFLGQT